MAQNVRDFLNRLPAQADGWAREASPAVYSRANLSDYIDGGSELFLSYGFRQGLAAKYSRGGDDEITVDIFDMGSSYDAFGVFAHSRETIEARFGQGSEYASGLLTFWKDRYYVSILATPETEAKTKLVFRLAEAIAAAIPREGPLPPVLARLPAEDRIPESVHYFHHYAWLNSFAFLSHENVLDIADDTPAAMAKYRQPAGNLVLILVAYPDEARARSGFAHFQKTILAGSPEAVQALKDGRWAGAVKAGPLVGVVLGAADRDTASAWLAKIKP